MGRSMALRALGKRRNDSNLLTGGPTFARLASMKADCLVGLTSFLVDARARKSTQEHARASACVASLADRTSAQRHLAGGNGFLQLKSHRMCLPWRSNNIRSAISAFAFTYSSSYCFHPPPCILNRHLSSPSGPCPRGILYFTNQQLERVSPLFRPSKHLHSTE